MHQIRSHSSVSAVIAANIAFAVFTFCVAFMLFDLGLPTLFTAAAAWISLGVFACYGLVLGFWMVGGPSSVPLRLIAFVGGVAIAVYLILYCVGEWISPTRPDAEHVAALYIALVLVGMLLFAPLQAFFGWTITRDTSAQNAKRPGQIEIRTLLCWMIPFALLLSLLRMSDFSLRIVLGGLVFACVSSAICLVVVRGVIGIEKRMTWVILAVGNAVLLSVAEAHIACTPYFGLWWEYTLPCVFAINLGVILATVFISVGLKLLGYRFVRRGIRPVKYHDSQATFGDSV